MKREVERNRLRKSKKEVGKEDTGSRRAAVVWELQRYGGRLLKVLRVRGRRPNEGRGQRSASSRVRRLLPLVLATMASQAVLVVLAPTILEVGREFRASVGAVAQARSVLAGAAIASSLGIAPFLDRIGVLPLLLWGALLAIAGSAGAALSTSLTFFLSVHVLTGVSFAFLLSAGFRRSRRILSRGPGMGDGLRRRRERTCLDRGQPARGPVLRHPLLESGARRTRGDRLLHSRLDAGGSR